VDGNNILHAWADLRAMLRDRRRAAYQELCHRLTAYQDQSGERVVAVFDGRGDRLEEDSPERGIQVFYSDSQRSADSILERLAARYAREYEITVATDDVAVQDAAIGSGGHAISSQSLRDRLERADSQFRGEWNLG